MRLCSRPRCGCLDLFGLNDGTGTGVSFRGSHSWCELEVSEIAVGSSMVLKDVNHCGIVFQRIVMIFLRCRLSDMPGTLAP